MNITPATIEQAALAALKESDLTPNEGETALECLAYNLDALDLETTLRTITSEALRILHAQP